MKEPDSYKQLHLYIDGASRGNPGESAIGLVIRTPEGFILKKKGLYIGRTTNNVAEYMALLHGVCESLKFKPSSILIHSDSKLLVNQLKGNYKVKDEKLIPLFKKVKEVLEKFPSCDILYINRKENKEADGIANRILDGRSRRRPGRSSDGR